MSVSREEATKLLFNLRVWWSKYQRVHEPSERLQEIVEGAILRMQTTLREGGKD